MFSYTYDKYIALLDVLQTQVALAGLPVSYCLNNPTTTTVVMTRELTPAEKTTLDGIVANFDGRPRRKRKLYDVFVAIGGLTPAQKTAIGDDLFGGTPPKLSLDEGSDAADLLVLYCLSQTGLSTADKNLVKQSAAAIYTRDNPMYLVNQTFGGTVTAINVPGDEPIG